MNNDHIRTRTLEGRVLS